MKYISQFYLQAACHPACPVIASLPSTQGDRKPLYPLYIQSEQDGIVEILSGLPPHQHGAQFPLVVHDRCEEVMDLGIRDEIQTFTMHCVYVISSLE